MKRVILTSTLILLFVVMGAVTAIFYAKGYRLGGRQAPEFVAGTGLLVLTSKPDGARVYVDGDLETATNDTINLRPGEYQVSIEKDGYFSWHKKVRIEKEVVTQANATLFPTAPRIESLTLTGAESPVIDPSRSMIAYTVASASATRNGIYIIDMNARPLIGNVARQIVDDTVDLFSHAQIQFSPDGEQILATIPGAVASRYYLLSVNGNNETPQNVSSTILTLQTNWAEDQALLESELHESYPRNIRTMIADNFKNPILSPEENKILYEASRSANLPIVKKLRVLSATPETRDIQEGGWYVYDIKEDRNYLLFDKDAFSTTSPHLAWHPNSTHLLFIRDGKIQVIEYDGKNTTTLYGGPFSNNFFVPWPEGSSIVILTKFNNPDAPSNLYRISLK